MPLLDCQRLEVHRSCGSLVRLLTASAIGGGRRWAAPEPHSGSHVDQWLTQDPNVTFHFTPTGSSWLNQVETWFGIITKQAIRRGTFRSVRQLSNTINTYITTWNHDAQPFTGPRPQTKSLPKSA
jgi:hypothetical protein